MKAIKLLLFLVVASAALSPGDFKIDALPYFEGESLPQTYSGFLPVT